VDPRIIVQLEGLGKLKKKNTSSGIEPTTFQLSASTNHTTMCPLLAHIVKSISEIRKK
jgi:hypothetical protein